jgi:hypothetical protein
VFKFNIYLFFNAKTIDANLKTQQFYESRDRDTQGLVHCAAITERKRARLARAEGIAQNILISQI